MKNPKYIHQIAFLIVFCSLLLAACGGSAPSAAALGTDGERVELKHYIIIKCPGQETVRTGSTSEVDPVFNNGSKKLSALQDYFLIKGNTATRVDVPDAGIDQFFDESCEASKEQETKRFFIAK